MFTYHSGYFYGELLISVYYIPSCKKYVHCSLLGICCVIDTAEPFFGEFY